MYLASHVRVCANYYQDRVKVSVAFVTYYLSGLNGVTSNHAYLLVHDNDGRIVIPDPIKLAAIDQFLYEILSIKKVVKKMIGLEHILFGWLKLVTLIVKD
jgi:hypothetical protein